jgi:multidrug efflux pump
MYLLGYSLNNLSLMAMAIAAGFVVDDAIIVLEEHLPAYRGRHVAHRSGAQGPRGRLTVVSMSLSLIAVFIPILLMGGIVGRLFREFAVTLTIAIVISMVVSLTTTPMMCAYVLRPHGDRPPGRFFRASERAFAALQSFYDRSLGVVLRHPLLTILIFLATVILNIDLYVTIPKGFFPQQDTAHNRRHPRHRSISFRQCRKFRQFMQIVREDPDIASVRGLHRRFSPAGLPVRLLSRSASASCRPTGDADCGPSSTGGRHNLFMQAVQDPSATPE